MCLHCKSEQITKSASTVAENTVSVFAEKNLWEGTELPDNTWHGPVVTSWGGFAGVASQAAASLLPGDVLLFGGKIAPFWAPVSAFTSQTADHCVEDAAY